MAEHPIHNLMKISMENIKQMVDVDTIVGNPVKTENGETIIPVSKVSFGFAAGGSEFEAERKTSSNDQPPFGGGSGGGVSITPIAFLVVNQSGVELKHIDPARAWACPRRGAHRAYRRGRRAFPRPRYRG